MDSNGDRQCQYGEGEYGINWGRGLLTLLVALALAAALLSFVGSF